MKPEDRMSVFASLLDAFKFAKLLNPDSGIFHIHECPDGNGFVVEELPPLKPESDLCGDLDVEDI
jgi:hypothetical protein